MPTPLPAANAGYSGTPLAKKLGIGAGTSVVVLAEPEGYRSWLEPLPAGVRFGARVGPSTDVVHLFVTRRSVLGQQLERLRTRMRANASVWVSWPKKAARVDTDITEDTIRELALPLGLIDVKVCAVSDIWSGLKLVIRKELR